MKFIKFIKKTIRRIIALAVLCVIAVIGVNAVVLCTTYDDVITAQEAAQGKYQCIFVLGCSVYSDGTPSPALKSRLDKAVELYNMGASDRIIMSGDHSGMYYNEVKAMKNYVVAKGVPAQAVFCDHYGISTYDSMHRAKSIFSLNSMLVVSQGYHVSRGVYDAKQFGIDAKGVASDRSANTDVKANLREIVGRCKDFAYCLLKIEPKYGGGAVDVSGNGNSTDNREDLSKN